MELIKHRLVGICGGPKAINQKQRRMVASIINATNTDELVERLDSKVSYLEAQSPADKGGFANPSGTVGHRTCNYVLLKVLLSNDAYLGMLKKLFAEKNFFGLFWHRRSPLFNKKLRDLSIFNQENGAVFRLVVQTLVTSKSFNASQILMGWMVDIVASPEVNAGAFDMMWNIMKQEGIDTTRVFNYAYCYTDEGVEHCRSITMAEHVLKLSAPDIAAPVPLEELVEIGRVLFNSLIREDLGAHSNRDSTMNLLDYAFYARANISLVQVLYDIALSCGYCLNPPRQKQATVTILLCLSGSYRQFMGYLDIIGEDFVAKSKSIALERSFVHILAGVLVTIEQEDHHSYLILDELSEKCFGPDEEGHTILWCLFRHHHYNIKLPGLRRFVEYIVQRMGTGVITNHNHEGDTALHQMCRVIRSVALELPHLPTHFEISWEELLECLRTVSRYTTRYDHTFMNSDGDSPLSILETAKQHIPDKINPNEVLGSSAPKRA